MESFHDKLNNQLFFFHLKKYDTLFPSLCFSGWSFLIFLKTPPLFKQLYFKESDHAWLLKDSTHYLVHALCFIHSLEVLVTLTPDVGKILSSLHRVQFKGAINFLTAVKIAHVSFYHFNFFSCYSATGKTVNAWNISGMVIVLWPITAKISIRKLAMKPQTN